MPIPLNMASGILAAIPSEKTIANYGEQGIDVVRGIKRMPKDTPTYGR